MKRKLLLPLWVLCLAGGNSIAQTAFPASAVLNINNIDVMVSVHGDICRDPVTGHGHCAVPSGSGKNIASAGALWMSGYDGANMLHVAAQTYRQAGNDYWPGPLDASGALDYATSQNWARVWAVTRDDISMFKAMYAAGTATGTNTPPVIWEWPAKGNPHAKGNGGVGLTITDDMAPFKDVNGDGLYNPEDGDYPDVPGDQNVWWVFSDNGPVHSQTNGQPLKVEVHALALAFKRWSELDNIVFFQYDVVNKSANTYKNFRLGQFADMDLGAPGDDYIGCDTARGLGIVYNGGASDAIYGNNMPLAGMVVRMHSPSTPLGGMGNFIYFNNDASATGQPVTPVEYDNYLRSKFKDGIHIVSDFAGPGVPSSGHGSGDPVNFVFSGNPADHTSWSECNSGNTPGDRKIVMSTPDFQFNAGETISMTTMIITTDLLPNNACSATGPDFGPLKHISDAAVSVYDSHFRVAAAVANTEAASTIRMYPNPASNTLYVENAGNSNGKERVFVYNTLGQLMNVPFAKDGQKLVADISGLPVGLYQAVYQADEVITIKFVKE